MAATAPCKLWIYHFMIKNEENPLVQDISAKLSKTNKIKNGKMLGGQNAKKTQK